MTCKCTKASYALNAKDIYPTGTTIAEGRTVALAVVRPSGPLSADKEDMHWGVICGTACGQNHHLMARRFKDNCHCPRTQHMNEAHSRGADSEGNSLRL